MGIKTGSKYYVFENGNENRVKLFREKTQENMGMKTWTLTVMDHLFFVLSIDLAYFSKETKTNIFTETMMSIENKSANNSNLIPD